MGGGPHKESLLITLWDPEPKAIITEIHRRFPHYEVTYFQIDLSKGVIYGKDGRKEAWRDVPDGKSTRLLRRIYCNVGGRFSRKASIVSS
jgi:hypothetical protein